MYIIITLISAIFGKITKKIISYTKTIGKFGTW